MRKNYAKDIKCTLLMDEAKLRSQKLERLDSIYHSLVSGKNVQNRQLKRWLTDDEYTEFEQEWEEQKGIRQELKKSLKH